jgi:hypothetical protein
MRSVIVHDPEFYLGAVLKIADLGDELLARLESLARVEIGAQGLLLEVLERVAIP